MQYFQTWKKVDKDYIHTVVFEAAYLIIAAVIIIFSMLLITTAMQSTDSMVPDMENLFNYMQTQGDFPDLSSGLGAKIQENTETVKVLLIQGLVIILLSIILLIANSCFFKGIIWARVHDHKIKKDYLIKFAELNAIWLFAWLIIIIATLLLFTTQVAAWLFIIEIVLLIYLTNVWRAMFNDKKDNYTILKKSLKLGFTNIHKAILPMLAIIATFYLYLFIIYYTLLILPQFVYTILFFFGIIFLICFSRSYFNQVIKGFK